MATAATIPHGLTGSDTQEHDEPKYGIGVLAGLEFSNVPNAKLDDEQKKVMQELVKKAEKRDYPARLVEVIQAWEAALFYRGFQFLVPQRGGGWLIPGESTGYGPSMQMDLSLLATNIYSARGQMIIAALTRAVPGVRFGPESGNDDAQITAAESADKYIEVIRRNNDLIMTQTDASRYAWTDGRWTYWNRFVKDGQRFGWEEDDAPDNITPETEPPDAGAQGPVEGAAAEATPESVETSEAVPQDEEAQPEEVQQTPAKRTPRGQEVRTCHGKLETKIVPMSANDQNEADVFILEYEVDCARAKGMFPWVADDIKSGSNAPADGEIARLARQNVKLGMQSSYVTSDSIASDCTVKRIWMRPTWFMEIPKEKAEIRDKFIEMFPNGCLVCYAGDTYCYSRNESMDDSISIGQAYSGDGQNRNAMGTSTMPIQKRLNNWLDLMNDFFTRAIPTKWMDNKTFNVEAVRGQTNIPGDIRPFKWKPGVPVTELIFVEPAVIPPQSLADFIKEYSGPLAELLSGAYPALAGGDVGTADSGVAIATQRDSALGRLAPTWHALKKCEAESSKQMVRWAAKCRDGSVNEKIPGGEVIQLEINDLKGNILCYAESDENFPETYTQKKNAVMKLFDDAAKNPMLGEVVYNAANVSFFQSMIGLRELYIPQVAARNKQLAEIELLLASEAVPNQKWELAHEQLEKMKTMGVVDIQLARAQQQLANSGPEDVQSADQSLWSSSIPVDGPTEDNETEAATLWQWLNGAEGRKAKRQKPNGYANVRLHYLETVAAAQAKAAASGAQQGKPPSLSANYKDVAALDKGAADQLLLKGGITPTAGATQPPAGPPAAATPQKEPAKPLPTGAPEQPPSRVQ